MDYGGDRAPRRLKRVIAIGLTMIIFASLALFRWIQPMIFRPGAVVSGVEYHESCLDPESEYRPVWECYELTLDVPVEGPVIIRHSEGEAHQTYTFRDGDQVKFRFTPSRAGHWEFSVGGSIDISDVRPEYAKGFVVANGINWIRTATGEAFVPQYVMYDRADLDGGLQEFVVDHGFTGFHIRNLRDFLQNFGYFEAVVLKTYRLGGVTHFWIWGDEFRRQTPSTYGVDTEVLYREIAARLGPLPGWTVGYGFDLFEWASAEEIESFRDSINNITSYRHMVGARGYKNEYREISSKLDYASWEWHRPTARDYSEHLAHASGRPAFSEDRFRVRQPSRYPEKDYDFDMTRRGLWHSALSGGVANIWGFKSDGKKYSQGYLNKEAIRTYRMTIDRYFESGMHVEEQVLRGRACLEGVSHILCYAEDTMSLIIAPQMLQRATDIVVIDTRKKFRETEIEELSHVINLGLKSDWAIVIGKRGVGEKKQQ